ncbi:hypothetical protein EYF80_004857 [Liparis tanakae]|uniref:Secreted protein n=1 Tax=Liparis tanakae TaxID=230148 RepID=A0A4Z2J5P3_9TELE|nr:hypothetical protein EYF80_004857 [Liparis tanakae]
MNAVWLLLSSRLTAAVPSAAAIPVKANFPLFFRPVSFPRDAAVLVGPVRLRSEDNFPCISSSDDSEDTRPHPPCRPGSAAAGEQVVAQQAEPLPQVVCLSHGLGVSHQIGIQLLQVQQRLLLHLSQQM